MRLSAAIVSLALATYASAHGNIVSYVINGVTYPAWQPYGASSQPGTINRPFYDVGPATPYESGTTIICNGPNLPASANAPVTAGSTVVTNWNWPTVHPGPVMAYLAKCNGPCASFTADGPWVKIQQDGYDPSQATPWAEERLRETQSWSFKIPKNIADGEYLLRTEILGLHAASTAGGAQFYPSCAHLVVSGGAGGTWPQGIKISGAYTDNDPGILVALYKITPQTPAYTPPGGPVLLSDGGSSSTSTSTSSSTTTKTTSSTTSTSTTTTTKTTTTSTTTTKTSTTSTSTGTGAAHYAQCGGIGWTGPTTCVSPYTCQKSNDYYSQCL